MKKFVFKIFRTLFRLFSVLAPGKSAKLALKLFCRTPGMNVKNGSERYKAAVTEGLRNLEAWQFLLVDTQKGHVAAYVRDPDPASPNDIRNQARTICVVHGWNSNAALMINLANEIRNAGYRVVMLDLPGFGRSSGRTFHLPLAVEALDEVYAETGPWSAIVAHSLGCAATASYVSGHVGQHPETQPDRLVLISSPSSLGKIFRDYVDMLGLGPKSLRQLGHEIKQLSGRRYASFDISKMLSKAAIPVTLLHAPDDREVSFSCSETIADTTPDATLIPLPGLGHRRIISDPATYSKVLAALELPVIEPQASTGRVSTV